MARTWQTPRAGPAACERGLEPISANSRQPEKRFCLARDAREHLPRADVSYQFKSEAGTVKVHITTAAETFRLDITAGKNPMAAQLACIELEKQLTFMAKCGPAAGGSTSEARNSSSELLETCISTRATS